MIYNPYFEREGIDAVVVPLGCGAEDYPAFLRLVDTLLQTAAIAGACNAVRREPDGRLTGEMFDGEGFVRGLLRKGRRIAGRRALVLGAGGVGSAIAASLAKAGVGALGLYDIDAAAAEALAPARPRPKSTPASRARAKPKSAPRK